MVVGPIVEVFISGAIAPPFFAVGPVAAVGRWAIGTVRPKDLQGHENDDLALMVRRQEPKPGHCQHYTPPAVGIVVAVGRQEIGIVHPCRPARAHKE